MRAAVAVRGGLHNTGETASMGDSQVLLEPIIGERLKFVGRVNTHWAAALFLVVTISLGTFAVVFSMIWPLNDPRECGSYFLAMYVQPVYWAFSFILDFYFRRKHIESRIEGYLEFYKEVVKYCRAPYYITTMWNALLLAMAGVVHQEYGGMENHCKGNLLDPTHFICALLFLEAVFNSAIIINYMAKVYKFNLKNAVPDAMRDEWMASFIRDSYSDGEVGYRERDNHIGELMEKQADLLRYLKEQNAKLVQKVMTLNLQLQEKHSPNIT